VPRSLPTPRVQEGDQRAVATLCQQIHKQVAATSVEYLAEAGRRTYVTPTSYLELLSTFQALFACKRAQNNTAHARYTVGLQKLEASAASVAVMQARAAWQSVLLRTCRGMSCE
jgi:dynein heavy chain, axonemal